MNFTFILAEKALYPITVLCRVLGVSRSGYHAWCKPPQAARVRSDAHLAAQVAAVHKRSRKAYGSPRVHVHPELRARGTRVGEKRVARLMRENGLEARRKRRFRETTDSNHMHPIAPNLLRVSSTSTRRIASGSPTSPRSGRSRAGCSSPR